MKFLLILTLSIATLFAESSASTDTTDNRQLQGWNPNCNTVALWHPVSTVEWSGGFCSLQITCNSPSYSTAADCCSYAYAGQSTGTCYTTAGIPVPTSVPVPGAPVAGTWYPNYPAGWAAGKCINTLPPPFHGSRPLYPTQLECCILAYAGQTNNFCIANMDGLPTSQYGTQWYPKYDTTDTCTTKLPLPPPGSRPYFASKEECCRDTFDSWGGSKTADCISGSMTTPVANPTDNPTTSTPTESPATSNPTSKSPTTSNSSTSDNPSSNPSKALATVSPFSASPSKAFPSASPVTAGSPFQSSTVSPSSASRTFPLILIQSSTACPSSASMTFPLILATGCSLCGLLMF